MLTRMIHSVLRVALIAALLLATVLLSAMSSSKGQWPFAGHDIQDTRYQNTETQINAHNVGELAPAWQFTTGGDVLATPAVDDKSVYFPDDAGTLYAVDKKSGTQIWGHVISDYTGIAGDFSTTTPALSGSLLFIGDQGGRFNSGARVLAINKQDGTLVWATQVEAHPAAVITQSAVVTTVAGQQIVYIGVNSIEDELAANATYPCCTFRGSVVALNAATGQIIWKTFMVPDNAGNPGGYSGAAVEGGTPAIDLSSGSLYAATGSNYTVPSSVLACLNPDGSGPSACVSPDDHFDSILALDLVTGGFKWVTRTLAYDAWNASCLPGAGTAANCPVPTGPAYDFAQGAMLFTASTPGQRALVGAGQRSGRYWALDATTGQVVWATQVGSGSRIGGLGFGAATDGKRVYVADGTTGFWSALDVSTGAVLWKTIDPQGAADLGAVSVANGVVYACSLDAVGHMYGVNASTGAIDFTFASGGSCAAGAAVSKGRVYWGSGYTPLGTSNNKFSAFQLP